MTKGMRNAVAKDPALKRLKERFVFWRREKSHGESIPTELLEAAGGLVGRYRPGPLAKALGLHYGRLVEFISKAPVRSSKGKNRDKRDEQGFAGRGEKNQAPRFVSAH